MSTIIKPKQFPNHKVYKTTVAGRPFSIEVGKMAELANASAMVRYGDTCVLVAVTASPHIRFPLPCALRGIRPASQRGPGVILAVERGSCQQAGLAFKC